MAVSGAFTDAANDTQQFYGDELPWRECDRRWLQARKAGTRTCSWLRGSRSFQSLGMRMEVFLLISEQQSGPFSLENLHKVHSLDGLPAGALVWCEGQEHWLPIADFLSIHPLPQA